MLGQAETCILSVSQICYDGHNPMLAMCYRDVWASWAQLMSSVLQAFVIIVASDLFCWNGAR